MSGSALRFLALTVKNGLHADALHSGQSMLFAGLFRSVLADVPTHLAGIGSGVLITLQQSGLALGVATLGTLCLAQAPHNIAHAFVGVEYAQMGIVALLAVAAALAALQQGHIDRHPGQRHLNPPLVNPFPVNPPLMKGSSDESSRLVALVSSVRPAVLPATTDALAVAAGPLHCRGRAVLRKIRGRIGVIRCGLSLFPGPCALRGGVGRNTPDPVLRTRDCERRRRQDSWRTESATRKPRGTP